MLLADPGMLALGAAYGLAVREQILPMRADLLGSCGQMIETSDVIEMRLVETSANGSIE